MEDIVKKLQKEAGITEEQAGKVLSVLKNYIDEEKLDMDWDKFFKGKYSNFKDTMHSFFSNFSEKAENYGEKISHKVEDLTSQAKDKINDITKDKKE